MRVLVTGAAGFIGYHLSRTLLAEGVPVYGYDCVNDYYDPSLKEARLRELEGFAGFRFQRADICCAEALAAAWQAADPTHVVHLAAQAGVRYSIENPMAYVRSNIEGFQRVIELVREREPESFVYASSSSVYGGNEVMPFREDHEVRNPVSLYAASKLANELVAETYVNLYGIPAVGLRFFTAYGPFSRPDMAMFKFALRMEKGEPLPIYNEGRLSRDFTYIGDIVQGVRGAMARPGPNAIYNLGRGEGLPLLEMVRLLEESLGWKAELEMLPMQPGDVRATLADISKARAELGFEPRTSAAEGIARFAEWFRSYRG